MNHPRTAATLAALAILATACSSNSGKTESATSPAANATTPAAGATEPAKTAAAYAVALKAAASRVKRVYKVTEQTDSNKLLGRPNGYTSAAVLVDKAAQQCTGAMDGIDCGVVVEVWPNAEAVAGRVSYIQGILKNAPALGSEFDYPAGVAVLRVNGKVVGPLVAKAYETAWRRVAE